VGVEGGGAFNQSHKYTSLVFAPFSHFQVYHRASLGEVNRLTLEIVKN